MPETIDITPDALLLRRIAGGDSDAAKQLHRRHSPSLYALVYGVLMDPADADLVVEGAFAQVIRRAAEFDPTTMAAYAWLSQVARTYAGALLHLQRSERGLRNHGVGWPLPAH